VQKVPRSRRAFPHEPGASAAGRREPATLAVEPAAVEVDERFVLPLAELLTPRLELRGETHLCCLKSRDHDAQRRSPSRLCHGSGQNLAQPKDLA
jgi:hypothetical protein